MSLQIQNSATLLYSLFQKQVQSCILEAKSLGLDVYMFETYRSPERQEMLFNQTPKVTNSHAWMSWHQYGLAVDLAFGGPKKWTWNGPVDKVKDLFVARGLRWIGPKDPLHFEYDHRLSILTARTIAQKQGVLDVWLEIEAQKKRELN